jgi:Predicted ATPase
MGDGASREVLDAVLASADGNPLFLEERLSSLLETRALVREQGAWRLSRSAARSSPQALERWSDPGWTGSARRRATPSGPRPCSAPSSPCPCWPRCAPPAEPLGPALDELRDKDFLHEVPGAGEPVYRFRHALIQEATYNGLLRADAGSCMAAPRGRSRRQQTAERTR